MLEKMGWTEGESLGKDNSGICEPVSSECVQDSHDGEPL